MQHMRAHMHVPKYTSMDTHVQCVHIHAQTHTNMHAHNHEHTYIVYIRVHTHKCLGGHVQSPRGQYARGGTQVHSVTRGLNREYQGPLGVPDYNAMSPIGHKIKHCLK